MDENVNIRYVDEDARLALEEAIAAEDRRQDEYMRLDNLDNNAIEAMLGGEDFINNAH